MWNLYLAVSEYTPFLLGVVTSAFIIRYLSNAPIRQSKRSKFPDYAYLFDLYDALSVQRQETLDDLNYIVTTATEVIVVSLIQRNKRKTKFEVTECSRMPRSVSL